MICATCPKERPPFAGGFVAIFFDCDAGRWEIASFAESREEAEQEAATWGSPAHVLVFPVDPVPAAERKGERGRTMSEAPKRAIELTLKVSADTWNDVRHRLFDYEEMIRRDGGISPGCMGGPSSGDIRKVTLNPDMTHERYFELLGVWLDEQHVDEAAERKGEGG